MDDEAVTGSGTGREDPVVVLGSGVLGHTSYERHTDRYGAVHLTVIDSVPDEPAPARTVPVQSKDLASWIGQELAAAREPDPAAAAEIKARPVPRRTNMLVAFDHAPLGAAGTLVAHVIHSTATDDDREFGKRHPELRPPETGERVVLGSGTLFTETYGDAPVIGVRPDDGRAENWMDPNAIYRCKDHLVRLEFEMPQDSTPDAAALRVQATRRESDPPQSAVRTAQADFPAANPLAPPATPHEAAPPAGRTAVQTPGRAKGR